MPREIEPYRTLPEGLNDHITFCGAYERAPRRRIKMDSGLFRFGGDSPSVEIRGLLYLKNMNAFTFFKSIEFSLLLG